MRFSGRLNFAPRSVMFSVRINAQSSDDPWLMVAGGMIRCDHSPGGEDLVGMYGTTNAADQDVHVGDGELQSATFLVPKD